MLCMYMNRNRRNMHKMIYYYKGGMQMYMNTGYLNQSHQDFKDKRQPLVVGSCGCYRLSTIRNCQRIGHEAVWIIRLFILLQERDTFILILQKMKRLSRPAISCCFDRRNFKSMSTMEKIRLRCTGSISLEAI